MMSSISSWINRHLFTAAPARGVVAYERAIGASNELIDKFEEASKSRDPIRAMFADMWLERHNVPYASTIYEAHQEMIAPLRQKPCGEEGDG